MQLLWFWRNQWFIDFPQNLTFICLERPAIAGLFRFKIALQTSSQVKLSVAGMNQA